MPSPHGPLCVVLAALILCSGARAGAPPNGSDDLRDLVDALAEHTAARAEGRDSQSTATACEEALVELAGDRGIHPLADHGSLGRAWWLARREEARRSRIEVGNVEEARFEAARFLDGLEVAYRIPKGTRLDGAGLPLVVSIPDEGERPAEHLRSRWTDRALLDGAIFVSPAMPAQRDEWDRVTVGGRPGGLCHVLTAVREATLRFPVDPDRIYVAGQGKGVPAAIAAGHHAPERFAAVLCRGGDLSASTPLNVVNFANLPVLIVGGGAATTAILEEARAAKVQTLERVDAATEKDVWHWIQEHPRQPLPERVRLAVGKPFPTRAHWLRIAPTAADAHATASVDRAQNTISVEVHGASLVRLYLNDALVDLDRELTVVCNGAQRKLTVDRSLAATLDMLEDETSDPGCVYVAELELDVVPAPGGTSDAARLESEQRLADAGSDVDALWSLYRASAKDGAPAQRVLRRVLRLDPDHVAARTASGHAGEPGLWFRTAGAFARYQRSQDPEVAAARGYTEHRGRFIHPEDRKFATKGWTWDPPSGQWLSRGDLRRLEEGWARQDLAWIPPADAIHLERGEWRVDGDWVTLDVANRRHSRIGAEWEIPGPEVVVHSTADRAVAERAAEEMGRAIDDLRRVFGSEPPLPLDVTVLRDEEQYDRFAFGDPAGRTASTDSSGLHVIHSAFFADQAYEPVDGKRVFRGRGVCYWDPLIPHGDAYGVHSARLAVGLSYVDAIDPSPKTVRKAVARGVQSDYRDTYESEKRLPAWLRYGGAVYAERYFHDDRVEAGGDAWWARTWSVANLRDRGGLRSLDEVLGFPLDPGDREDGLKLLLEAGLLVAFMVDGECPPVAEAAATLRRKFAFGTVAGRDIEALEQALIENEGALRTFAGRN